MAVTESTSLATSDETRAPSVDVVAAIAIAVADMIGIGVFTSLGFQVRDLPSAFTVMVLWSLGGLVALCGALSYAELATALPRSGGEYNFLSRIYHPALGFMAGWISATVGFAAPVALAAMAFAEYFSAVVPGLPKLALALALVWVTTGVLLAGARPGILLTNAATSLKVALIVAFIVAGFLFAPAQDISFLPTQADFSHIASAPFAISLVYVMYSYSGWNALTYISDEVREPEKTLPVSIVAAVLIVMALSLGLNAVFLYTTPMSSLAGQIDVGVIAGQHIFGATGARLVAAIICVGLVSAVTVMMWIGPRVTMVMGEDVPALRVFAGRSGRGVPARALLFQLGVVSLLLATQSFEHVLEFIQFSLLTCSALAVLGVIVLRVRQPDLPRPFRVWAYPVTPLVFFAVMVLILGHLLREKPLQSLLGLAMMASGLVIYAWSRRER